MATNFPTNPSDGDTHAGFTYSSTSGAWESSVGQSGGSVTVSDTAPSSPSSGDLWWHSTDLKLYVYYTDGLSNQWVQTNPSGTVSLGVDDLTDVDTTTTAPSTGQLLQWNGTNWVPYTHTNGITHIDTWRLTSDITSDAIPITTWTNTPPHSNLQPTLGTAMSHSNGVFSFPVTGYWEVQFIAQWSISGSDNVNIAIQGYESDGTTTRTLSQGTVGDSSYLQQINLVSYYNCTNTSNNKVQFYVNGISAATLTGDSSRDKTYVMFKRIADAV